MLVRERPVQKQVLPGSEVVGLHDLKVMEGARIHLNTRYSSKVSIIRRTRV